MAIKKTSGKMSTPIKFTPVEHLPSVLAVLLYGRSGTGKTTIAASFPTPLLLLDIREKGTDSVANVKGALQRLKDGQVGTVDGNRGIVWLR